MKLISKDYIQYLPYEAISHWSEVSQGLSPEIINGKKGFAMVELL
jgi:hypothetical protein